MKKYFLLIIVQIILTSCGNEDNNKTPVMKEIDNKISYLINEAIKSPAIIVDIDNLTSSYLLERYGKYPSGMTEKESLYLFNTIDESIEDEKDSQFYDKLFLYLIVIMFASIPIILKLKAYLSIKDDLEEIKLKPNKIYNGTVFEGNSGTIINNSTVNNSLNNIVNNLDEDSAKAIIELGDVIAREKNLKAAEFYKEFTSTIDNTPENKVIINSLWNSIKEELPTIKTMVSIVAGITKLFQ